VLLWCLPSLLGFAAFLVAFPIDRVIPFWPHLSVAEVFFFWFLFVAPSATAIAIVIFKRHIQAGRLAPAGRVFAWVAMIVAVLVNAFVLFGLWASTY
jgi:hypothetical protein